MPLKKIYIRDNAGNNFESDIEAGTTIGNIAADFFEAMEWDQQDGHGGGQRAVVEILDPKTKKYTRLRPDLTVDEADIPEGAILSIYAEAVAGAILDKRRRLAALKTDKQDMAKLKIDYPYISFITNEKEIPDEYAITFRAKSFVAPPIREGDRPETGETHIVNIALSTEYPREAPYLYWQTPLFHPNVSTEGQVCLGMLRERYLPGLGLKRVVLMLDEMLHWRNYDFFEPFNPEVAEWARKPANWPYIEEIGGIGFNIPYKELINPENWGENAREGAIFGGIEQPSHLLQQWFMETLRPRVQFTRVTK
jgi:ubiquitin-protein ligase